MKSHIESRMKGIPQIINIKTLLVVVLDGFDGRQFALVDPTHELPRSMFFVSNFLNFVIKESMFCGLNCALEYFPIFQASCCLIIDQGSIAFFIPPALGMSCNSDSFSIRFPCIFNS